MAHDNAAHYVQVEHRLRALMPNYEAFVPGEQMNLIREFLDVGEYGLALEWLADELSEGSVPVEHADRREMVSLSELMHLDGRVVRALAGCPER